ncbi:MAG: TonB-dependent receptor [Spirochaetaceae bacterium]|nr:TonB-dependent receptor [Spirochaetaceae bacterium]
MILFIPFSLFAQEGERVPPGEDALYLEAEELTVVASPETTQQIAEVSRDEIERRNAADLASLLQEALNLGITRYGAYGNKTLLTLRGFDAERVAFLVDGIPMTSPQDGEFDLTRINPATVERIEVVYGGSDTKYNVSGAFGGVINIITVRNQEPGLRIGGSIANTSALPGTYRSRTGATGGPDWEDLADTQNLSLYAAYGGGAYSLSGSIFGTRAQNHFLYKDGFGYTRRKISNEVWDAGGRLSFVYRFPNLASLIFSGDVFYSDKNVPTSGGAQTFGVQEDFNHSENVILDMPRAFHDTLAMEASLTHNGNTRDFTDPAGTASRHEELLLSAINRWSWFPSDRLTFRMGGDYRYARLDSTDMGSRYRHDGGVYLTAEYQLHRSFLVIPSIKGVFSGPGTALPAVPVPKLGFLWTPTESLSIKNNYFRSFKHPDFEALYWAPGGGVRGNPDLNPEDGWGGDLGLTWRYRDLLTVGSTLFAQLLFDSIHWSPDSNGIWLPQNVGKAAFFGSENRVKVTVPLSGAVSEIGVSLSWQFLLGYLLSHGYTWKDEKRIPYQPMHTLGLSLDMPWTLGAAKRAGSVIVSGTFETVRYSDRANLSKLDPHFLLNLSANQELNRNFTVFLALHNVLNSSYESFESYPMPGLTATLGLRAQF